MSCEESIYNINDTNKSLPNLNGNNREEPCPSKPLGYGYVEIIPKIPQAHHL